MPYQITLNDHEEVSEGHEYGFHHGIKDDYRLLSIELLNKMLRETDNPRWLPIHHMICTLVWNDLFEGAQKDE